MISLPGWTPLELGPDCHAQMRQFGPVRAILTWDNYPDTEENFSIGGAGTYRHLSLSCADCYPAWDEMKKIIHESGAFDHRYDVLMVLPRQNKPDEYVNIHTNCFHWFQKIGGWGREES